MSTLVKGGTIVTAGDTYEADILIDNGIIALIGNFLEAQVDQVIDASGSYVLPGAIDAHTHLELSVSGTVSSDDFYTGTVAAACGGTTTIIDYADQVRGEPLAKGLEARLAAARGKAAIDYGFHLVLTEYNARVAGEMAEMVSAGVSSFKCFLAYKGRSMIDDGTLLVLLSRSKDIGALTCVHCENGEVIDVLTRKLLSEGKTSTRYHPESRPPEVEAEATGRAIALAEMALAPVYIVHLTTAQSLEKVRAARARGLTVYAETCPQY
ncbi:MAG: amidohydrolase family protein, partial [Chloroflexi bacterium]|nr:amidohydrolase family protein [Chloroflexota bacterium]